MVLTMGRAEPATLPDLREVEAFLFREAMLLDEKRWAHVGTPMIVDQPRVAGSKSLALPAGGSAVAASATRRR